MNCSKVTRGCQKIGKPQKSHQFVDLLSCYSDNGFNSKIQRRNLNLKNIQPNIPDPKYFPLHNINVRLYYEYALSNAQIYFE